MSYTIYSALEHLGLTAQKRAIHIQFSNNTLNEQVFLQHIEGTHTLHSGIKLQLICLSTHAHIPLKQFIGSQTAIDIVTDRSELTRISGIVTQAEIGASDGSLTLYRLTVEDATALWKHRRNSRVFMNKTAVEIIQVIFKEWQLRSPLFASSLSLDLSGLSKDYDVRPFTMQYNEADTNLIQRLLAEEGISSLIDEAQLKVSSSKQPIQAQKLRLIDNNNQYQALERRNIRFHRSSAVEQNDSITSFIGQRTIQPTAVHIQRWQADILDIEDGAGSVLTKHRHSDNQNTESLGLEQAWHFSPAWTPDLNGADGVTPSGNRQVNDEPSLEKGVRSTAWLVYLGKDWLEKLGEIKVEQYANTPLQLESINEGLFFQADEFPQLARIGLPRPQGYQALNNILRPIREKMLPLTQYADSLAEWEPVFFQPEQCDWWLERWDREDDAELLEKYPVPEYLKPWE